VTIRRVLITGAGGFIGSHLVGHQLGLGREVTALDVRLDRLRQRQGEAGLRLVEGDIRDTALLERSMPGTDVVFHLASAHLEVIPDDRYFRSINVDAARSIAEMAAHEGVQRLVHCSSVGVYGPLAAIPADEDTPCHPDIAYEVTKLEGERAVLEVAAARSLAAVVLRPAWVYGPGCPRTARLFRALRKRRFLMVGSGSNLRHPVYIDDMLQAFELAATRSGVGGQVFVIASDECVTLRQLIATILEVGHSGYRPARIPLAVMRPVCYLVEGVARVLQREPPFSTRSLKFFTEDSAFCIAKARRLLGYEPAVGLLSGLEKTHRALSGSPNA